MDSLIPFNKPYMSGKELFYISSAYHGSQLSGDGPFTKHCSQLLEKICSSNKVLITHSCTAALEMSAILMDIQPGDEVIMPSFTFVSTANAVVLRGGIPVFVDVRSDTLNLNEKLIETAISEKTKAIMPVHYAGVGCEMNEILQVAKNHNLFVVEDAAQGIGSLYEGKPLGSLGQFGALSFHETKNISSGEGGALLINDPAYIERAEIIREKGTNRRAFIRGEVDKYTWTDLGSSFLPGEITAAFLRAQLESVEYITNARVSAWNFYHQLLNEAEAKGFLQRPSIPSNCQHNGHLYYVLLPESVSREDIIEDLKRLNINTVFHYVALHSSPSGQKFGRTVGDLEVTQRASKNLLRLPLFTEITKDQQEKVVHSLVRIIENHLLRIKKNSI
jgi:dTDP-4-amino-4,6-dideoxygalactose transaminase